MKKILFITTILWLAVKMPAQDALPVIVSDTISSDTIAPRFIVFISGVISNPIGECNINSSSDKLFTSLISNDYFIYVSYNDLKCFFASLNKVIIRYSSILIFNKRDWKISHIRNGSQKLSNRS